MNIAQVYSSPASIPMQNIAVLTDKNKGSIGNKMDCAAEHTRNTLTTTLKGSAAAVGIGAATGAMIKSKSVNNLVEKGVNALKNTEVFKKYAPEVKDLAKKGLDAFNKLPGTTKIIAGVGAGLAAVTCYLFDKSHSFKAGQIDQKYTDKAQLQKTLEA